MSRSLLPLIPAALQVVQVLPAADRITILIAPKPSSSACPLCGALSSWMHSHCTRTLADLPWQGRAVAVQVRARRFRCATAGCLRQVFAERLPGVAPSWARRTARLGDIQRPIGLALGGEPGSRLAARLSISPSLDIPVSRYPRLSISVSGEALLRLVQATEREPPLSPRVVGIDDWAWRRGQRYGAIVCDLERERVIDLLPDRSTEAVASWLRRHPSIEVVARDRAGVYAEGARQGAPKAKQVADRWRLLRNRGDALQGAADRHRGAIRRAARAVAHGAAHGAGAAPEAVAPASHDTKETRLRADRRARRLARYEELRRLHGSGLSVQEIAPALSMSATAAYRWLKAGGPPPHDKPAQPRPLDPYVPRLEARWREGCRNGWRLWRARRALGFAGSGNAVARWAAHRRREDPPPRAAEVRRAAAWPEPSSRRCARLLTTAPDKLEAEEGVFLAHLAKAVPDLARAGELASRFAALTRGASDKGAGAALDTWLADAKGTALDAFARGIKRDYDAVLAALVEPWSTGPVEGQINRLTLLKRTMYGRASYDPLRCRVLAAA